MAFFGEHVCLPAVLCEIHELPFEVLRGVTGVASFLSRVHLKKISIVAKTSSLFVLFTFHSVGVILFILMLG